MEKQIAAPIVIPYDLEQHIGDLLSRYTNSTFADPTQVIPVHDPTRHDAASALLPSLNSTAIDESGNLRYLVITNESMWAGQHRVLDEVSEILWTLFHWLTKSVSFGLPVGTESRECLFHVVNAFRNRVLPEFVMGGADANGEESKNVATKSGLPVLEALLFRAWAFCRTPLQSSDDREYNKSAHELFDEEGILYPFPDDLFWNDGDEGEGLDADGGVPKWRDVVSSVTGGSDDSIPS